MTPFYADDRATVHHGDCLDVLRTLPDASVDAVVTDPPYGLEFMGKEWDAFGAGASYAGITATGYTDGGNRLNRPAFNPSPNPTCRICGGLKFLASEGSGGRTKCRCDAPEYPNYLLPKMRAFQAWCEEWAAECLRVLKPGGHLLAFGGTRTWHRLTCAVEDAGFDIRDTITWLYGSGFPKSLDVGKAIDKAAGAEREVVGTRRAGITPGGRLMQHGVTEAEKCRPVTAPATVDAARWQGWGTALKPASEPVVVARKPLTGTVAANVLTHGTGALNIDATRVAHDAQSAAWVEKWAGHEGHPAMPGWGTRGMTFGGSPAGRWPANVVLTHGDCGDECVPGCPVAELDAQSGILKTHGGGTPGALRADVQDWRFTAGITIPDQGGASRFFPTFRYQAKAPTRERPSYTREGSAETWAKAGIRKRCANCGKQEVNVGTSACACPESDFRPDPSMAGKVTHPTVKPLALMAWLIRLVTPPGGVVLDPFAGSGTTVEAALAEGFRCITIEREAEYLPLILARIERQAAVPAPRDAPEQMSLLDEPAA